MRFNIILLSALLPLFIQAQSADNFCGSVAPESYNRAYAAKIRNYTGDRGTPVTRNVPIVYHIITQTDGSGGMPVREVIQSHCELNNAYASTGIYFYISDIVYINNTSYYEFGGFNTGSAVMNSFNVPNVCNVYINNDPAGVCGYAFFPGSGPNGGGIFVKKGCYGTGSTTLIHEMGHYFGLYHTFEDGFGIEYVDGSNCNSAGDLFCDTPADFIGNRWTCPYTGNDTDPQGDLYRTVLDGTLYMSYSNDRCQNRFSPMQRTEMYNNLLQLRSELLTQPVPNLSAFDTVVPIAPLQDTAVDANNAWFRWHAVPGATHYIFQIPSSNPSNAWADTVITDTFIRITGLFRNRAYQYRVRPFSYGYACANYTMLVPFKTSGISLQALVAGSSCSGDQNGLIQLQPLNGLPPYRAVWSSGDTVTSLSGLAPGTYQVTVTDGAGERVTSSYTIADPAPLQVTVINPSEGVYVAQPTGGTPGYTYNWSNGTNADRIINAGPGVYQLQVIDQNGCITTTSLNIGTGIAEVNAGSFGIQPNPVKAGESIMLLWDFVAPLPASLQLFTSDGRWVQELKVNPSTQQVMLPAQLNSGFYLLQYRAMGKTGFTRLLVY